MIRDNDILPLSVISAHNSILAASLKLHYSGCCTIHTFYTIVISEFFQADGQCFISETRSYARKSRVHRGCCLPSAPFIPQVTNCNLQCTLRHSAILLDRAHRVNFETMIKLESMIKFNFNKCLVFFMLDIKVLYTYLQYYTSIRVTNVTHMYNRNEI